VVVKYLVRDRCGTAGSDESYRQRCRRELLSGSCRRSALKESSGATVTATLVVVEMLMKLVSAA
jgi:hypothetical protein